MALTNDCLVRKTRTTTALTDDVISGQRAASQFSSKYHIYTPCWKPCQIS